MARQYPQNNVAPGSLVVWRLGPYDGCSWEVLPHWFWLFTLLSRSLLEKECHMLQKEISDLQVSTALSLPQVLCLAGITLVCLWTYVYVKVCESYTCFSCFRGHGQQF